MSRVEFLTVDKAATVGRVDGTKIYRMIKRSDIVLAKLKSAVRIH